jgi:hypothetical protein
MTSIPRCVVTLVVFMAVLQGGPQAAIGSELIKWDFEADPATWMVSTSSSATVGVPHGLQAADGVRGKAALFEGDGTRIEAEELAWGQLTEFTVSCFVRLKDVGSGRQILLELVGRDGNAVTVYAQWFTNQMCLVLRSGDTRRGFLSDVGLMKGAWQHIAVTLKPGEICFFVNGERAGTRTFSGGPVLNCTRLIVGGAAGTVGRSEYLVGAIDSLSIDDTALRHAELRSLGGSFQSRVVSFYKHHPTAIAVVTTVPFLLGTAVVVLRVLQVRSSDP